MKLYKITLFLLFIYFPVTLKAQRNTFIPCDTRYQTCIENAGLIDPDPLALSECRRIKRLCEACQIDPNYSPECASYPRPPDACFDEKPYNPPIARQGDEFDWKAREWRVWVKTDGVNNGTNVVLRDFPSPFYINDYNIPPITTYQNNPSLYGLNLNIPQKPTNLDGHAEDGWLLLYHEIGNSTAAHERPLFVFYNKNRAIMRVFWLLGTRPETYNKVQVELGYKGAVYKSNLLSTYQSPLLSLDKGMKPEASLKVNNEYTNLNYTPYWVYGEFPMVYDPCGCEYERGQISLDLWGIETYNINLTLKSQPYAPPSQNTIPKGEYGFMDFIGDASKLYKLVSGLSGNIGELNKGIKATFGSDVPGLTLSQNTFNNIGKWINLVPQAGGVVSTALSIVDFFTGGGDEKKQASAPTQVVLMNDFVGTGTMEKANNLRSTHIQTPGAKHISTSSNMPYYDNPLGIMNLVYTPKMELNRNTYQLDNEMRFRLSSIPEFTFNPFLGTDIASSEIDITLELDIKNNGFEYKNGYREICVPIHEQDWCQDKQIGTNLDLVGTTLDNRLILRSPYTPINCDVTNRHWWIGLNYSPVNWGSLDPKFSLKVVARLKRKDPITGIVYEDPAKHITYIAKYAVDINALQTPNNPQLTNYAASTSLNVPDYQLEFGDNPGDVGQIVNSSYPTNYVVLETIRVAGKVYGTHNFTSGSSIELLPGALIAP